MLWKYAIRSFRSRKGTAFAAILTVLICLSVLILLSVVLTERRAELETVYDTVTIPCTVSDAKGSTTRNLSVPSSYLRFFDEDGSLYHDVKDVRCLATASFLLRQDDVKMEEKIYLYLTNTIEEVGALETLELTYLPGYGPQDFYKEEAVGIISESCLSYVGEDGMTTLYLPPKREDSVTFRVIATFSSDQPMLYLSLTPGRELLERNERSFTIMEMSFVIADNRRLDEIKMALSDYFVPANRYHSGISRWGLLMDDVTFIDSVAVLERSIALFSLFRLVLVVLSGASCFLIIFLLIRRRRAELAVMRSLGCSASGMYLLVLSEYAVYYLFGALPVILLILSGRLSATGLWSTVGLSACCWMLFVAGAVVAVTSGDIVKVLKGKE